MAVATTMSSMAAKATTLSMAVLEMISLKAVMGQTQLLVVLAMMRLLAMGPAIFINGTDSVAAGAGEVDTLSGSSSNDRFILGDEVQTYYSAAGDADYALIADFNASQDFIQLNGLPENYSLMQVDADTHLLRDGELVAILANEVATDLDLNSRFFIYRGSGVDLLGTDGDELLEGGDGFDFIEGRAGNDTIIGGAGNDNILGEDGNDIIDGGSDNDVIDGGKGDDVINGGAGDDFIEGGNGADTITGGSGNDEIIGGASGDFINGTDSVAAGAGEVDTLSGSSSNDRFILGDEVQTYYSAAGDADYALIADFNASQDFIQLNGLPENYSLMQVDADTHLLRDGELVAILANEVATDLDLNSSNFQYVELVFPNEAPTTSGIEGFTVTDNAPDTVIDLSGVFSDAEDSVLSYEIVGNTDSSLFDSSTIEGGSNLVFDYASGASGVTELTIRATDSGGEFVETSFDLTVLDATESKDELVGGEGDDYLNGESGGDKIFGAGGNDVLIGSYGSDKLDGGAGNDTLDGRGDSGHQFFECDVLTGGDGSDTYVLGDENGAYYSKSFIFDKAIVKDFTQGEDTLVLHGSADQYKTFSFFGSTLLFNKSGSSFFSGIPDLVAVFKDTASIDLSGSGVMFIG